MTNRALKLSFDFIRGEYDTPRNTKEGNMKLQKLLYFSYLVHLAEFNRHLFDDPICAYKNGCVVEDVMNTYNYQHDNLIRRAYEEDVKLTSEENFTVSLVKSVFGKMDGIALGELTHNHESWKQAYRRSFVKKDYRDRRKSIVDEKEILEYDIGKIKEMTQAYKDSQNTGDEAIFILEGTEFYYDPREIIIDKGLEDYLRDFIGEDEAFTIYKDVSQGVVVY